MKVMTWEKFKKLSNAEVDWSKDYYGLRHYGNYYKFADDLKTVAEVVRSYVEDKANAEDENISIVVYVSKPHGWDRRSYDLEIWVK